MEKKKISVIISVYNTEKYLEKCLDSVLNQTYQNLEIILIDDGSVDNSKKLLKKYEKNKKCKVLYNEGNKGLAYSRNVGMKVATGEYIGFIDSDDYIEPDYYKTLMTSIEQEHSDIAICDINLVFEKDKTEALRKCCEGKWNIVNLVNNGMSASACNKLFKSDLIKKYEFAVGKVNEDIAVVIPALVNAKKVSYASCKYNYIQRENSIQNSKFSNNRFDIFEAVDTTLERIQGCKNFEEIKEALIFNQIILLLFYVIPKDKRFFYRGKILKKFNQLSQKYDIRNNKFYWHFADISGKKHAIYYRLLLKFVCTGHYILANLLLVAYKILARVLKGKNVIKKSITIEDLTILAKKQQKRKKEKVGISVIVPNYNYERFLIQRIYSILKQNYKIEELILLDDCSKDNSRVLIDKLEKELKPYISIRKIYNEKNSGSAFKQWQKGFEIATGDYVWIAEADDYCSKKLIKKLVHPIVHDRKIVISYADTAFIDTFGNITMKSIKPQIDLQNSGHWDKSFINEGLEEIKEYAYLNCTIANVSSCLIKKGDYQNFLQEAGNYKQAGDWLFYVHVMQNGKIAYLNQVLNYYRIHGNNVSSIMNHKKHLEEMERIHTTFIKEFKLGKKQKEKMEKRRDFLKKCWELK